MSFFKKLFNKEEKPASIFFTITIDEIIRRTDKAVSLRFKRPESGNFDFVPGQYITFKALINGEDVRRAYSLNSLPSEDALEVTVKEMPDGYFSKYANNTLKAGDTLEVMAPAGLFKYASASSKKHYVAFAGGSGITPIFSIIKSILQQDEQSQITLIYGNRTVNDIIFYEELSSLAEQNSRFKIVHVLSDETNAITPYSGFIDAEKVSAFNDKYIQNNADTIYYLCGPGPMVLNIEEALINLGATKDQINTELFTTVHEEEKPDVAEKADTGEVLLKVKYSYKEYEIPFKSKRKSVLDTVLDAGVNVPFSCLNGVCSTCSARLLKGSVKMDQNFALERDDLDKGYILTCQSHPTSSELEIDFDDSLI